MLARVVWPIEINALIAQGYANWGRDTKHRHRSVNRDFDIPGRVL
jgi:hypothetical protein